MLNFRKNIDIYTLSILKILSSITLIFISIFITNIINILINNNLNSLNKNIIYLGIVILFNIIVYLLTKNLYIYFYLKSLNKYKENLYLTTLKTDTKNTLTNYIQNFNEDINIIINARLNTIPSLIYNISIFLLAAIILCIVNYLLFLIIIFTMCLISIIAFFYYRYIKKIVKSRLNLQSELTTYYKNSLNNKILVKLYNSYDKYLNNYKIYSKKYFNIYRKEGILYTTSNSIIYVFSYIIIFILILFGSKLIINNKTDLGVIILIFSLLNFLISPIISFSPLINSLINKKASLERINYSILNNTIVQIPDFDCIILENITYINEGKTIINNLSYKINKYDLIKINGESGIGKSTLIKLILNIYKLTSGNIYVIYQNNQYDIKSIYHLICYLAQENKLFNDTIRNNFNYYQDICDEKIYKYLKLLKLDNRINNLDLVINDDNDNLSVGEKQRLILAITLSLNKEIYFLDEYNNALDNINNLNITNILESLNKTIIYINHTNTLLKNSKELNLN